VKGAQPSGQTGAEEGVIPTQHVEPTEGTPPEQTPESGNETAPEKDQQGSETKPQGQGAVDNPPQVDKPANDGENAIDDDY
jgi:hypothetical protein